MSGKSGGAYGHIEKSCQAQSAVLTEYYTAKQLKEDLKQRDLAWKQKFAVTHDLREGQAQHQETTEQNFKEVHARIDALVRDLVPRAEVEKRMTTLVKEVQGCMDKAFDCNEALKELTSRVQRLEQHSAQTFATKLELEALEKRQAEALRESRADAQVAIDSVRQDSAPATKVDQGFNDASERSAALEESTTALRRDLTQLDRSLESLQHRTEDRFAKKLGLKELEATLMLEIQRRDDSHASRVDGLRGSHASKQHVDDRVAVCSSSLEALRENLSSVSKEVNEKSEKLAKLEQLCKETLVPRIELEAVDSTIKEDRLASQKISADVLKLTGDLDSDRERLEGVKRSSQSLRSDLNQLAVSMQEFRELRDDYNRNKSYTAEFKETLEHRESEHFREMSEDHILQKKVVEKLEKAVTEIKAECKRLGDQQEKDNMMLKDLSTKNYLEAMDHALGLSDAKKGGSSTKTSA